MVPLLLSGARGRISYTTPQGERRVLGMCLDIAIQVAESVQQTMVIGSYNPVTQDPTAIDVNVSLSTVVPVNPPNSSSQVDSTKLTGIGLGLEPSMQIVMSSEALTIDVIDAITDKVIASVRECRFAGRSTSTASTSLATSRYNFVGVLDAGYQGTENSGAKLGFDDSAA